MWYDPTPHARAGDAAPPFSLPAHDGRAVSLVEFRGRRRVVVTFYPQDDAAAGGQGLSALQAALPRFEALGAQVVAIGRGQTGAQAAFAERLGLGFPLLSDPAGQVARAYGAKTLLPAFSRRTFVVDGRGVLRLGMAGRPDVEQLLTFLGALHGDLPAR